MSDDSQELRITCTSDSYQITENFVIDIVDFTMEYVSGRRDRRHQFYTSAGQSIWCIQFQSLIMTFDLKSL